MTSTRDVQSPNFLSRHVTSASSRRPWSSVRSSLLAAMVLAGLSACGGGTDAAAVDASPVAADDSLASVQSSTTAPEISSTPAPVVTEAPLPTDPPVASEMTPELATFAAANGELVDDWSTQLNAFGDEAIDHLDDVSKAPAATSAAELSEELVATIGLDTTDDGLVTLRTFAEGMSMAFGFAIDGDQDAALSVFLGLQAQSDALTAVLDQFGA